MIVQRLSMISCYCSSCVCACDTGMSSSRQKHRQQQPVQCIRCCLVRSRRTCSIETQTCEQSPDLPPMREDVKANQYSVLITKCRQWIEISVFLYIMGYDIISDECDLIKRDYNTGLIWVNTPFLSSPLSSRYLPTGCTTLLVAMLEDPSQPLFKYINATSQIGIGKDTIISAQNNRCVYIFTLHMIERDMSQMT